MEMSNNKVELGNRKAAWTTLYQGRPLCHIRRQVETVDAETGRPIERPTVEGFCMNLRQFYIFHKNWPKIAELFDNSEAMTEQFDLGGLRLVVVYKTPTLKCLSFRQMFLTSDGRRLPTRRAIQLNRDEVEKLKEGIPRLFNSMQEMEHRLATSEIEQSILAGIEEDMQISIDNAMKPSSASTQTEDHSAVKTENENGRVDDGTSINEKVTERIKRLQEKTEKLFELEEPVPKKKKKTSKQVENDKQ